VGKLKSISEHKYRTLVEQASDGIFVADAQGNLVEANTRGCEMLGYTHDELLKLQVRDILASGEVEKGDAELPMLQAGSTVLAERIMCRKDGSTFLAEISTKLLSDGSFQGIARDIAQRKANERRLEEYAASQTELLNQLMTAQEAERRRLQHDIHDGPLQSLGVTLLSVDRLLKSYKSGAEKQAPKELEEIRAGLAAVVNELRAVLADLSVEMLTHQGLASALRDHAQRFTDLTGIVVKPDIKLQESERIGDRIELLLYRLAQESLTNIRRHSRATQAEIQLGRQGNQIEMVIRDNGRGFDVKEALSRRQAGVGIGLRSMLQRMKDAHGSLTVESEPGKGTLLIFRCPLPVENC
jgi:PAS domain S-box-containing protein